MLADNSEVMLAQKRVRKKGPGTFLRHLLFFLIVHYHNTPRFPIEFGLLHRNIYIGSRIAIPPVSITIDTLRKVIGNTPNPKSALQMFAFRPLGSERWGLERVREVVL